MCDWASKRTTCTGVRMRSLHRGTRHRWVAGTQRYQTSAAAYAGAYCTSFLNSFMPT